MATKKPKAATPKRYYKTMAAAVGEVVRISNTRAKDEEGNIICTNSRVTNIGSGQVGQPKAFSSAKDFVDNFKEYIDYIIANDYIEPPTFTGFSSWAGIDTRTAYLTRKQYYPEVEREIQPFIADCIASGAMMGKYKEVSSIFALKNWAGWTDKRETTTKNAEDVGIIEPEKMQKLIKQFILDNQNKILLSSNEE